MPPPIGPNNRSNTSSPVGGDTPPPGEGSNSAEYQAAVDQYVMSFGNKLIQDAKKQTDKIKEEEEEDAQRNGTS